MCGVSVLYVICVCMCEWNFSHVSLGSEGQTLPENPHIPQRTGTHLQCMSMCKFALTLMHACVSILNSLKLQFSTTTSLDSPTALYWNIIYILTLSGFLRHIHKTQKPEKEHSKKKIKHCKKQSGKGQRELKGEDKK